jgi:hypothetical protein
MFLLAISLLAIAQQASTATAAAEVGGLNDNIAAFDRICFTGDQTAAPVGRGEATWNDVPQSLRFLQKLPATHTISTTGGVHRHIVIQSVGNRTADGPGDRSCARIFQSTNADELVAAVSRHFDGQASTSPVPLGDAKIWSISRGEVLINVASSPDGYVMIRRIQLGQPLSPPSPVAR